MKAAGASSNENVGAYPGRGRLRSVGAGLAAGLLLVLGGNAGAAEFPQGLMLHFSFDEAPSGGVISDRSGRGHDGRVRGATWTATGKRGGGCTFASSNACITVSNVPALRLKQGTYATWLQTPASNTATRTIFDRARDPRCVLEIVGHAPESKAQGRLRALVAGQTCLSGTNVTDGAWHHAAVTFDGKTLKLYVDGSLQPPATARDEETPAADGDVVIGMNRTGTAAGQESRPFNGTLDDVMIFNHMLTEAEVGAVIASVKPKFTPEQVSRRVAELKELLDSGLILKDFYDRKVKECETGQ